MDLTTRAVVLKKHDAKEADASLILFTQELGKIRAQAKSLRKIQSKLAGHLEPMTLAQVRIVNKRGYRITDAISIRNFKTEIDRAQISQTEKISQLRKMLAVFALISESTLDEHPDQAIWQHLESGNIFGGKILIALGFDPLHALCSRCGREKPEHFIISEAEYACRRCFSSRAKNSNAFMLE